MFPPPPEGYSAGFSSEWSDLWDLSDLGEDGAFTTLVMFVTVVEV